MSFAIAFKTDVVRVRKARHEPGKLKDKNDPSRGTYEDSFYVDAAYEGGMAPLRAASFPVFQALQEGAQYVLAGEVEFTKFGPRFTIHQVYRPDGSAVAGTPPVADGATAEAAGRKGMLGR